MIPGVETTAVHVVRNPVVTKSAKKFAVAGARRVASAARKVVASTTVVVVTTVAAVTTVSAGREARRVDTTVSGLMKSCVKPSVKVATATATAAITTVAITMATAVVERFCRVYQHRAPRTRLGDRTRTVTKCVPKHVPFLLVVRTDIACFFILRRILPFFSFLRFEKLVGSSRVYYSFNPYSHVFLFISFLFFSFLLFFISLRLCFRQKGW